MAVGVDVAPSGDEATSTLRRETVGIRLPGLRRARALGCLVPEPITSHEAIMGIVARPAESTIGRLPHIAAQSLAFGRNPGLTACPRRCTDDPVVTNAQRVSFRSGAKSQKEWRRAP